MGGGEEKTMSGPIGMVKEICKKNCPFSAPIFITGKNCNSEERRPL
jgi:hypothetical protein